MWLIHTFVMSSTMASSSLSPYSDAYFCLMGAALLADRDGGTNGVSLLEQVVYNPHKR